MVKHRQLIIFVVVLILATAFFVSIGNASPIARPVQPQPIAIYQPRGYYVRYHRPYLIGQMLFGDLWVFVPSEPQQLPAPSANPAPAQNPANNGPLLIPAR